MQKLYVKAGVFHYLFSANYYDNDAYTRTESVDLSVKMSNMIQVYQSASGEIFSNREVINYYYPSIYALEEINFMLMRAMADHQRYTISDTQLGEYLVTFENIETFRYSKSVNLKYTFRFTTI